MQLLKQHIRVNIVIAAMQIIQVNHHLHYRNSGTMVELYYRKYLKCMYAFRKIYIEKRKCEVLYENEGFVCML